MKHFILFCAFALFVCLPGHAEDMPRLEQDAPYQKLQNQLIHLSKQNRHHEISLEKIEKKLHELDTLKAQKSTSLQKRQHQLQNLIRAIQRLARHGPDALAQTSNTPDELLRSVLLLRSLLQQALDNNRLLQTDLRNLHIIRQNIDEEKQKLTVIQHALQKQSQKMEALLEQRRRLLKKQWEKQKKIQERVNRLARDSKNIHDLIRQITPKKPAAPSVGKPPPEGLDKTGHYDFLPVQGKVISSFGNPSPLNTDGMGTVISARPNARVLSPIAGEIVFAGPFRLYQHILIIKHHKNYYTLLAGLDRLDASVGQSVEGGEPLGVMQGNANSTLYMELRREGEAINPAAWLPPTA